MGSLIGKVLTLILTGVCLAIGFHIGKKVCNKMDYHLYMWQNGDAVKEGKIP